MPYSDPVKEKLNKRHQRQRRLQRNRDFINKAKDIPCIDCKQKYPSYVMTFDHLDPKQKSFEIGQAKGKHSIARLEIEIAKCEVVCFNCHAVRTHKQAEAGMFHWG